MADEIESLFREVDVSNDGRISTKELGKMFKRLGVKLSVSDVKNLVYEFDKDGSRDIDLKEFRELINSVLSTNKVYEEAYEAFKVFDTNGDNVVSRNEVKEALSYLPKKLSDAEVEELINKMDTDGNGLIYFDEFAKAYACGH
ncbi:calmodulin-like [Hydractinia symbiolongicarpus]|uniref:calmodulin-like n=1 Tax=Hydractinia symbiolongicarpus TaxID=13093 RepID=UPI00254E2546|nr:calmodulin-like [Hydractinia symbiolongicarpus]